MICPLDLCKINERTSYTVTVEKGKQLLRKRLFDYRFSEYSHKTSFTVMSTSVKDEEGTDNFATLIIRNDNPKMVDIITEFTDTVNLLNTKP